MTRLTPEARFKWHNKGERSNSLVERNGLRLLPKLYAFANPMPYAAAKKIAVELAIGLRGRGMRCDRGRPGLETDS